MNTHLSPIETTVATQSQPQPSTSHVTGEELSLHVQDGPYGPLLRYDHSDGNLYYLVARTLESYLESETICDISNALYQQELDRFIQDSRFADLTRFPLLTRNISFLFDSYYAHETEVTFKTDNPDEEYSDEDLDDTLPYNPPPPIHECVTSQVEVTDPNNHHISQVDGTSDYGEDFRSALGSPAIWKSYALDRCENQFFNWDHLAERLYRSDHTIVRRVTNDLMVDGKDDVEQDHLVYSEIDEVVEPDRQETHTSDIQNMDNSDMHEACQYENSYMGARNNFFLRHSSRAPGQPPHWGHHQLNFQEDPYQGNNALFALK